jgi:diadenosine tetraphosphate (Ap4A) HIT family hydrolase
MKLIQKLNLFALTIILCLAGIATNDQCCVLCNDGIALQKNHEKLYCQDSEITCCKLLETPNFYVAIDNYPVCKDHILIVPREHKFSYSVIDLSMSYEFEAIIMTLSTITDTKNYGLFEHGSNMVGTEQKACGNSIYHAHMHFIPNIDMQQNEIIDLCMGDGDEVSAITLKDGYCLESFCFSKKTTQPILEFLQELPTKEPYLFCYYSNSQRTALCVPDSVIQNGVTSQFFRRIFAEYFQKESEEVFWNWKNPAAITRSTTFRQSIIMDTIEKFSDKEYVNQLFERNLESLRENK